MRDVAYEWGRGIWAYDKEYVWHMGIATAKGMCGIWASCKEYVWHIGILKRVCVAYRHPTKGMCGILKVICQHENF